MNRIGTIFLFIFLFLANANLSFAADPNLTIQWHSGQATGNWQMLTSYPQINSRIVFAGPTKTFSNDCQKQVEIPQTPRIFINNSLKTARLYFFPPTQDINCPDANEPLWAYVTVEVGPLSGGDWKFEIASAGKVCQYSTNFNVSSFDAGYGTADSPYQIASKQDLLNLAANTFDYDKYYILTADINMAGDVYQNALIAPYQSSVFMPFKGSFNGNGFKISGLTINAQDTNGYLGLFGTVLGGQIKNLTLENVSIKGSDYIGSLVGQNRGGIISNCSSSNCLINGQRYLGGLIGENNYNNYPAPIYIPDKKGIVSNCCSSGQINGTDYVGGLVGRNFCDIIDCNSNCTVSGTSSVGGLAGHNQSINSKSPKAYIFNCNSSGLVANSSAFNIGGMVGSNIGDISDCNSNASVSGNENIGGLVGSNCYYSNSFGSISKSRSSGQITGNNKVGGLVGYNQQGNISDCNSSAVINAKDNTGGLIGYCEKNYANSNIISNCSSNSDINGQNYVGGLIGYNKCKIFNCNSNSNINGFNNVGGLVGYNQQNISNCNSSCSVYGNENVSCLVGNNDMATIDDCNAMGFVKGKNYVGGVIGKNWGLSISDCKFSGTIEASESKVGGLIGNCEGSNDASVTNCSSTGKVTGKYCTGGLIGYSTCKVLDCYSLSDVNGFDYTGGLIGKFYSNYGLITNCYTQGDVKGTNYIGGLVGETMNDIVNSYSTGNVIGTGNYVGGLAGKYMKIVDCFAAGNVFGGGQYTGGLAGSNGYDTCQCGLRSDVINCHSTGNVSGKDWVGGLLGQNNGTIENCYSTGTLTASGIKIGGVAAYNAGIISRCYATGDIFGGTYYAGGIAALNSSNSTISDCYTIGSVSGNSGVGGLAGHNSGNIINCYSLRDVNGSNKVGGLAGSEYGTIDGCVWNIEIQSSGVSQDIGYFEQKGTISNCQALGTSEMMKRSTYTADPNGWDFVNTWDMGENQTYPYLRQYSAGDIDQDKVTDYFDLQILAENWLLGVE